MQAATYNLVWNDAVTGMKKTETKTVSGGTNTFTPPAGIGKEIAVWITSSPTAIIEQGIENHGKNPWLKANPNPFNSVTALFFYNPKWQKISLSVFNVKGELISKLLDKKMAKGKHYVKWPDNGLIPGVYVTRLATDAKVVVSKILLIK